MISSFEVSEFTTRSTNNQPNLVRVLKGLKFKLELKSELCFVHVWGQTNSS